MRRPYSKIWLEDGPEAVLRECFSRSPDQRGRSAFMQETTYGFSDGKLVAYSLFSTIYQDMLNDRKYFVTLWDYRPGIAYFDVIHDDNKYFPRKFLNDAERLMIEEHAKSEHLRMCAAFTTPFDGVL